MLPDILPTFDELPAVPGHEDSLNQDLKGCAWQLWGEGDELGTINLLEPAVVKEAAHTCIQTGVSIRLDWPLNYPTDPAFNRQPFEHEIKSLKFKAARDDILKFNPQSGSQWDGLRHYGVVDLDLFYGGVTNEEIPIGHRVVHEGTRKREDFRLSIHHWAEHGINGRGILLDVARYASQIGIEDFDPFNGTALTVQNLLDVARLEGVPFKQADILLVRLGCTENYLSRTVVERSELKTLTTARYSGIEQSEDMKRFLWNNHFSALVGDSISFETLPPAPGKKMLHQTILGLWGCPIGELFDLEKLSIHCAREKRYEFFFSSTPLIVIGGVSSPPCAQAIF